MSTSGMNTDSRPGTHPARSDRPVRIANCSGFYGDRLRSRGDGPGGPVDVVTGDYLAEVTMLVLARSRLTNPEAGYAASFLRQSSRLPPRSLDGASRSWSMQVASTRPVLQGPPAQC